MNMSHKHTYVPAIPKANPIAFYILPLRYTKMDEKWRK